MAEYVTPPAFHYHYHIIVDKHQARQLCQNRRHRQRDQQGKEARWRIPNTAFAAQLLSMSMHAAHRARKQKRA